jgi:hypothetical protein
MTTVKVVGVAVLMCWFSAAAFLFALVADRAEGVSHSDAMLAIPIPFLVAGLLGHTVKKALEHQEQRIARLEAELARRTGQV